MKPQWDVMCLFQLAVFYLGVQLCLSSDAGAGDDPNNIRSFEDDEYGTYDVQKEQLFCYSCVYHVQQGNAAGLENCRDPFIKTGIPQVSCTGACAKLYHKISDIEYTITRTCLPNCKDLRDERGYTQCCTGSLCNGTGSSQKAQYILIMSSVSVSTYYMFR